MSSMNTSKRSCTYCTKKPYIPLRLYSGREASFQSSSVHGRKHVHRQDMICDRSINSDFGCMLYYSSCISPLLSTCTMLAKLITSYTGVLFSIPQGSRSIRSSLIFSPCFFDSLIPSWDVSLFSTRRPLVIWTKEVTPS